MAKVRFYVDSGANIKSQNTSDWKDTVKDMLMEEGEWESLTDDQKWEMANDWAQERIDIGYEEENDG